MVDFLASSARGVAAFESLEPRRLLATFTVTTLDDDGAGSFRQAIADANDADGADVIVFADELRGGYVVLDDAIAISGDLEIRGPGRDLLTLGAAESDWQGPEFRIESGTTTISDLTIEPLDEMDVLGGATLSLERVTTHGENGFLVVEPGGRASATNCWLQSVMNEGTFDLIESFITYLHQEMPAFVNSGVATIERSLIANNNAWFGSRTARLDGPMYGGGILNESTGSIVIRNSTISGNHAATGVWEAQGGGIYNAGVAEIYNSTITGNRVSALDDEQARGAGIFTTPDGTTVLHSTIVSGNTNVSGSTPLPSDLDGDVEPGASFNLIGDGASAGGLADGVNGNLVGVDPLLGELSSNGGPTQTHALLSGSPALEAGANPLGLATDQRGLGREVGSPDIGAYERGSYTLRVIEGGRASGDSRPDGSQQVLVRNTDGSLLVFDDVDGTWTVQRLRDFAGAPEATSDGVLWTDARDGLTYVAAPTEGGLVLFSRDADGGWGYRGLRGSASHPPARSLTVFAARSGDISIAGLTSDGDLVMMRQTGTTTNGVRDWEYVDISFALAAQDMATPDFVDLTSYVTPWDAWTIAGIDSAGDIQGVWISPALEDWRTDNLSTITGAPPLSGQLSVTQTSWQAINLGGVDASGNLVVTWWVPGFGGNWRTSNLTNAAGGPALLAGQTTGFTTSWGAINYVGVNTEGDVVAFWWTPSTDWAADPLVADLDGIEVSDNPIAAAVSTQGNLSVLARGTEGEALRFSWTPGDGAFWMLEDLGAIAERRW